MIPKLDGTESMRARVLIVETDEAFCQHLSQRLCLKEYEVFEVHQEEDARKVLESERIDVVLLDLRGLKYKALYLLRIIKSLYPLIEVILITSSELLSLSIAGMKLGAFDDFQVPLDLETLLNRIQEACCRKREKEMTLKCVPLRA